MVKVKISALCFFLLFSVSCGKKEKGVFLQKGFVMSVPIEIRVYGGDQPKADAIGELILKEVKRIGDEFSYTAPYSYTSYINKNAYYKWVKIDPEMYDLLKVSKNYYDLTSGAFDITFAPLWPIWKEAASIQKIPSREEIDKAIAKIGYGNIIVDEKNMAVIFKKPVEINFGGVLRGYSFVKILEILEKNTAVSEPIRVDIGTNMLCWGERDWSYDVFSPFDENKKLGVLKFNKGVVISSSGRSHFVKIEGKLYSHILNIKTGYPIDDFSNLIVYLPEMNRDFISSAALAVMGREKAFEYVGKHKGACAVWVDGAGNVSTLINKDSLCRWEKPKRFLFF